MDEEQGLRIVMTGLALGVIAGLAPWLRSLLRQLIEARRQRQRR